MQLMYLNTENHIIKTQRVCVYTGISGFYWSNADNNDDSLNSFCCCSAYSL